VLIQLQLNNNNNKITSGKANVRDDEDSENGNKEQVMSLLEEVVWIIWTGE
jgi:hypothetical protein